LGPRFIDLGFLLIVESRIEGVERRAHGFHRLDRGVHASFHHLELPGEAAGTTASVQAANRAPANNFLGFINRAPQAPTPRQRR
jgi:hypothetical protein